MPSSARPSQPDRTRRRHGDGAKMGMDATKPLDADEMKFKRIRVPGEEDIDLDKVVGPGPSQSWRKMLGK